MSLFSSKRLFWEIKSLFKCWVETKKSQSNLEHNTEKPSDYKITESIDYLLIKPVKETILFNSKLIFPKLSLLNKNNYIKNWPKSKLLSTQLWITTQKKNLLNKAKAVEEKLKTLKKRKRMIKEVSLDLKISGAESLFDNYLITYCSCL